MKELLGAFIERQKAMANEIEKSFEEYFKTAAVPECGAHTLKRGGSGVAAIEVAWPGCTADEVAARIALLPAGPGLYVIMTDRQLPGADACSFTVPGSDLRAIYRGHSSNVRDRIMGHLTYDAYMAMCRSKKDKKPWGSFIKIDENSGDGGLDVAGAPYNEARWAVVAFDMKGSSETLRELAECGFSLAFGTPVRSAREPGKRRAKLPFSA